MNQLDFYRKIKPFIEVTRNILRDLSIDPKQMERPTPSSISWEMEDSNGIQIKIELHQRDDGEVFFAFTFFYPKWELSPRFYEWLLDRTSSMNFARLQLLKNETKKMIVMEVAGVLWLTVQGYGELLQYLLSELSVEINEELKKIA